jgi:hypothetical protein
MMTIEQITAMPFKFNYQGNQVSFKQRYTKELAERIWTDPAMQPYRPSLVYILNKERTHAIICGITTSDFVDVLMRTKRKHLGFMAQNAA